MIKIERDVGKVVGQSFLVIEAGEPFQKGDIIKLTTQDVVIGRATKEYTPDICFNSPIYFPPPRSNLFFK